MKLANMGYWVLSDWQETGTGRQKQIALLCTRRIMPPRGLALRLPSPSRLGGSRSTCYRDTAGQALGAIIRVDTAPTTWL